MLPLLTLELQDRLLAALRAGEASTTCSVDLGRSQATVEISEGGWAWQAGRYPWLRDCRDRTVYFWEEGKFEPVQRFTHALIKLVPTQWGTPTFEIDGIKMLVSAQVSPWTDAQRKVALIEPRGKTILDTCGGLGYFAEWCLQGKAERVLSFEKNPDVIWLRGLNPWSPPAGGALSLTEGDICERIAGIADRSVDAILHDPPRFGIAGELYSQAFYGQLARVIRPKGKLFHYTGTPNKVSRGRNLPAEVSKRLKAAGFATQTSGDGILGVRR